MNDQQDNSIWPFLCLLTCLFVLSATSPRAWEKELAQRNPGHVPEASQRSISHTSPSAMLAKNSPVVSGLASIPCVADDPSVGLSHRESLPAESTARLDPEPASDPAGEFVEAVPASKLADQLVEIADVDPDVDPADPNDALLAGPMDASWFPEPMAPETIPQEEAMAELPWAGDVDDLAADAMPSLDFTSVPAAAQPEPKDLAAPLSVDDLAPAQPVASAADLARDALVAETWHQPQALLERLEPLAWECETGPWARDVASLLRKLGRAYSLQSDETWDILGQLNDLCEAGSQLATRLDDPSLASAVRRTRHALRRRVDIWELATAGGPADEVAPAWAATEELALCLADVQSLVGDSPEGRQWQHYLQLDALRDLVEGRRRGEEDRATALASEMLNRLARQSMTPEQQQFLARKPLAQLREKLRDWTEQPAATATLLEMLERYEQTGEPRDARALATAQLRLAVAPTAEQRKLANRLESHYRNANVRFTVCGKLLDRFAPEQKSETDWVRDRVLGNPVCGTSVTTTDLAIQLVPDPARLRIALVIRGLVASETSAFAGPATFFNSSASAFAARKDLELGVGSIQAWPTNVNVENNTRLRGLQTEFDAIPILGSVVQEIALSQHRQKQGQADWEVKQKIVDRVSSQIDGEVSERLGQFSQRLNDRLFGPLAELSLGPAVIGADTDQERMTMRLRIAAPRQLGANTPRPQAPVNCLASLQIHESALNNVAERLEFDGQTFTLEQLRRRIATRMNRPEMLQNQTPYDEDLTIAFAPQNAIQVRCRDGRFEITLSIATLWQADNRWDEFQVQAFYRPELAAGRVELVRDGVVYLIGDGLNMRSQIALRGIFSKAFSKQRPMEITPDAWFEDARMAGLGVTQFVVEDGWIGAALGTESSQDSAGLARRPSGARY